MTPAETTTQSRARNKPLRTYGKRTLAVDARIDPPSKKQRISEGESSLRRESSSPEKEDRSPNVKPCVSANDQATSKLKPGPKKGSIMDFFKPIPQPLSVVSSPRVDEAEPGSSPPSSPELPPLKVETKRKSRFLRFRGSSAPCLSSDGLGETEKSEQDPESGNEGENEVASEPQRVGTLANMEARVTCKTKKVKARASPTVQTTLNISSQAAFSECKICNTVWNPLYPDDVKFHKKQHTAVLRRKRKLEDSEL